MTDTIFKEIASEIKSLHNGAMECIKSEKFEDAAILYRKALIITEKLSFYEGMGMTLYNMANLSIMVGDLFEAINNAADAKDMFEKAALPFEHCSELISKLAASIKKKGIEYERNGKFHEAIEYFEAYLPFGDQKSNEAIIHEINLLRRIINDKQ